MRMELVLRFDYGSIVPWVRTIDDALVGIAGPDAVSVRTPVDARGPKPPHATRSSRSRRATACRSC